jgi:tetraacyldisaccharide 4'-kinase
MKSWYQPSYPWVTLLLLPFSWIFRVLTAFRYFLFKIKLKKIVRFAKPLIVVGNITVGGTGKTPFVIWLANLLKKEGFRPGIVSRGVGGKKHYSPHFADISSDPRIVGDEALMLARRTACPIVLCIDRVQAVQTLLSKTACDVVISDDGLQHYRMGRDIEIAMVDGERQFGNACFLPAGPLRESKRRLKRVNFVVEQGQPTDGKWTMQLQGEYVIPLQNENHAVPIHAFHHPKIHAVAGIGNPTRFFMQLKALGFEIIPHIFPDHYLYQVSDFDFKDDLPILMTEKDAVKCLTFADARFWYLPVDAKIHPSFEKILLGELKYARC